MDCIVNALKWDDVIIADIAESLSAVRQHGDDGVGIAAYRWHYSYRNRRTTLGL